MYENIFWKFEECGRIECAVLNDHVLGSDQGILLRLRFSTPLMVFLQPRRLQQ